MGKMANAEFSMTGSIAVVMKDLEMIRELSKSVGAFMPVTSLVAELHRKLIADGLGERDTSEFIRLYRPQS